MTWTRERWLNAWGYADGTPEADAAWAAKLAHVDRELRPLTVVQDIDPYRSIVTGEVIAGRRQHREHLKEHRLIEVGNERAKPAKQDTSWVRPALKETYNQLRLTGRI